MAYRTHITLERPLFDKMLSTLKLARTRVPYESYCHYAIIDAINQAALSQPARAQAGVAELVALDDAQREAWAYLWRWVERGLFEKPVNHETALKVMLHHPSAPWSNGEWDVTHKPYAEAFYAKFPKARPGADALAALGGEDG